MRSMYSLVENQDGIPLLIRSLLNRSKHGYCERWVDRLKEKKILISCEIQFSRKKNTNNIPESPRHDERCWTPRAQITLDLKIKNGKSGMHCNIGMVFKGAYCKIGAKAVCVVFVKPFPMTVTSKFFGTLQANSTGLITSLNCTLFGSLIKPMSLFRINKSKY